MRRKIFTVIVFIIVLVKIGVTQSLPSQKQAQVDQYKEMITKFKSEGNMGEAANYLNKIGNIYLDYNGQKEAIDYFNQALEINKSAGNNNANKTSYLNLGKVYADMNQFDKALTNYQKSLQISRSNNNKDEIASCLINMAGVQSSMKKYNDAVTSLEEAMNLAKASNNGKLLKSCYGKLADNYKYLGNVQKSGEYQELYMSFDKYVQNQEFKKITNQKDSQLNQLYSKTNQIEAEKHLTESQLKVTVTSLKEFENLSIEQKKQIYTLSLENQVKEMKNQENEAKLRQTQMIIISIIGFALLLAFLAMISFRAYRHKKKTNVLLEKQNKEIILQKDKIEHQNLKITDSITYAQRIQQSFLSSEESLQKHFPESFIVFKPRDIVSGDFYWFIGAGKNSPFNKFHKEELNQEDKFIIAAVDCTGHGVPGAFMSMIGYNQLNVTAYRGLNHTDEILNELHKSIRYSLRQHKNDNRDGMDMAICILDRENDTLEFSGAKNPLVYIKNNEITVIKGDRFPIGGIQLEAERIFSKHIVKIDQPISFYIFSDGFIDQFGGEEGEKFSLRQLSDLLLRIDNEDMAKRKSILEESWYNWCGNEYVQTDDILVMGFKLNPSHKG